MNRKEKILDIVEKIDSISGLLEMFPEKVSDKVLKTSAADLRNLADKLEELT